MPVVQAQQAYPVFTNKAGAGQAFTTTPPAKPYTIVVYGGVGCGFSQYLIAQLHQLNDCRQQADIVLIMDQPADSIMLHMAQAANTYATYTNTLLQYKLSRKADIYPQVMVYHQQVLVDHIIGLKEGMLARIRKKVMTPTPP